MTNEKAISIIKNAFSWYEDNARESEDEDWSGQHEALRIAIQALEQRWIPVSDRLPEESLNSVIGWDSYRERCVFVQYIDGHFQITGSNESFDIVAWMPLPEPYKAESEE